MGTTQVTYTYADGAGNSASCSFNVLVIERKWLIQRESPVGMVISEISVYNAIVIGTQVLVERREVAVGMGGICVLRKRFILYYVN